MMSVYLDSAPIAEDMILAGNRCVKVPSQSSYWTLDQPV